MLTTKAYPTGGEFLLEDTPADEVFTPEDFDETQRMIADSVREFIERSVKPHTEEPCYAKRRKPGCCRWTSRRRTGEWGPTRPPSCW